VKLALTTHHYEMREDVERYLSQKINKLQRYLPRSVRKTAHAEVIMSEQKGRSTNPYVCEIILHLPHGAIVAKEATINMFAAVDIVEAKLKNQLARYKSRQEGRWLWRRFRGGGL
jgi:ribosomal subunit interface protein